MAAVNYVKEQELAGKIIDRHIRRILNLLYMKGYTGWFFGIDHHGRRARGLPVPGREGSLYSISGSSREGYSIVINDSGEGEPEVFALHHVDIARYPSLFSQYARRILQDLEKMVVATPDGDVLPPFITRENFKRAINLLHRIDTNARYGKLFFRLFTTLGRDGTQLHELTNRDFSHGLWMARLDPAVHGALDNLFAASDDSTSDLHDTISRSMASDESTRLYEAVLPLLPVLDQNDLLLDMMLDGGIQKELANIDNDAISRHLHAALDDVGPSLATRFGDISLLTKSRQADIIHSLHREEYSFDVPLPGISASITFEYKHNSSSRSPLSEAVPSNGNPKLLNWDKIGIHIFSLLAGDKSYGTHDSPATDGRFSRSISFQFATPSGRTVPCPGNFSDQNQSEYTLFEKNRAAYLRIKGLVLLDVLREFTATGRAKRPLTDALRSEILQVFQQRSTHVIESVMDAIAGKILDRFDMVVKKCLKAPAQTKPDPSLENPSPDLGTVSLKIARVILSGLKQAEPAILILNPTGSRYSIPVTVGDDTVGHITFSALCKKDYSRAYVTFTDVFLIVGDEEYKLTGSDSPYNRGPYQLGSNTKITGPLLAGFLKTQMDQKTADGHPLFADMTDADALAFVDAIKKAFAVFMREQAVAVKNEKEVFYEAFERDFSEEVFEHFLMRGNGC